MSWWGNTNKFNGYTYAETMHGFITVFSWYNRDIMNQEIERTKSSDFGKHVEISKDHPYVKEAERLVEERKATWPVNIIT